MGSTTTFKVMALDNALKTFTDAYTGYINQVASSPRRFSGADAAVAFAAMRKFEQVNIDGGKHLWVGEDQVRQVLNEIVKVAAPWAYPLPNEVEL